MKLTADSVVVVSRDQMASDIAGETVILGLSAGRYYGLDAVGARIWQLIQTPKTLADVRETLVHEYDVEPGRCEADLLQLLEQMLAAGLVEIHRDAEVRSDAGR